MKKGNTVQSLKGLSFAAAAKKVSDRYPQRDLDNIQARSFMAEMGELMKHQEMLKLKESAGKAIKNYRQPVEASAYAKKAFGGVIDPSITSGFNFDTSTDWDATNPWAGVMMAQASQGQTVTPTLPGLPLPSPKLPGKKGVAQSSLIADQDYSTMDMTGIENLPTSNPGMNVYTPKAPVIAPPAKGGGTSGIAPFEDWLKNNMYAPLAIGKGVEAAGKLAMLATGYDKAVPQYNPYESKIRQIMETRGVDLTSAKQDILSAENATNQQLGDVRSANVRTALQQNLTSNTAQNLARTSMQQEQIQTGLQGEYASTLNNLGQQRVSAENYAEQLTQQSKAGYQMGLQTLLESAGNAGNKITDSRASIAQQRLISSVLQTKDFKLSDPRGVLTKAIQNKEISNSDFYSITSAVQSGAMTQEELDAAIEKAKQEHVQRTGELTTQKFGGWLKKITR